MSRYTKIKWLISLGVLIAVSCSFFTTPIALTPSKTADQEVSVIITTSHGGELTLPDHAVLKIPAGSLQSDTTITLRKISSTDLSVAPEDMSIVGGIYDINLGTANLQKPATLEIPFDPELLPAGTESGQVFLSYYDETKKEWVYAGGLVDTSRNVVVLEITHASWWIPATWNWGAWIAVLDKLLSGSIVDWVEAAQLLTDDCPQSGQYVQVDSSQARNMVQGCVENDDSQKPVLRIINPKSFFYEITPISGGNGYPEATLLSPGEDVKFEASTSDPSPLIVNAELTQKSGWYLVIHMVITMLPGANQFGIQPSSVACITERLADVSDLASAVESLLVGHDGAAAAESLSNFMLDGDAVRRFLTAADDCHFGPAPTWSLEGIKQIGGAVSTIMSSTDYIANYFAENSGAQVSFTWTPPVDMNTSFFDDFSNYSLGLSPSGWTQYGTLVITPIIVNYGGTGTDFQRLEFPAYTNESTNKALIRDGLYGTIVTVTVKLNFQTGSDGGGIIIAWKDPGNYIAILPNPFWDEIVIWEFVNGQIQSTTNQGGRYSVPINTNQDYWLKVVTNQSQAGGNQLDVFWSTDGSNYFIKDNATDLANLSGQFGVGTYQFLSDVLFDDFSVNGSIQFLP